MPKLKHFLYSDNDMITKITGHHFADAWVQEGRITRAQPKADRTLDLGDRLLAPGVIDLQVNGGYGIDLLNEPERVDELSRKLKKIGYAGFLATLISASESSYKRALPFLQPRKIQGGAELLGIHLEGPCLNPEKRGAHTLPAAAALPPLDGVKLVTLAPEHPQTQEWLPYLERAGVRIACGHTAATQLPNYCSLVTHLFNAMTAFHHRRPGLIGQALTRPGLYFSLIADGHHLHPTTIDIAYRCKPEGVILISDGMAAMGVDDGEYQLGTQTVTVDGGVARLTGTATLAGATLPLTCAMRNYKEYTRCTIEEALLTATFRPASFLGISDRKGTLSIGADADLIAVDASLNTYPID